MFKGIAAKKQAAALESLNSTSSSVEDLAPLSLSQIDPDLAASFESLESDCSAIISQASGQETFASSLEKFGPEPGLMDYALRLNVFNDTSLSSGSMESLLESDPELAMNNIIEGATEGLKETVAAVAEKAKEFVSKAGEKIKALAASIGEKAKAAGTKIKETAKAHPYATAAAAVATVALAGTVIAAMTGKINMATFTGASSPDSWRAAIFKPLVDFKNGFGVKVVATETIDGVETATKFRTNFDNGTKAAKAGMWASDKIDPLLSAIGKAASRVTSALSSFGSAIMKFVTSFRGKSAPGAASATGTVKALAAPSAAARAASSGGAKLPAIPGQGDGGVGKSWKSTLKTFAIIGSVISVVAGIVTGVVISIMSFVKKQVDTVTTGEGSEGSEKPAEGEATA